MHSKTINTKNIVFKYVPTGDIVFVRIPSSYHEFIGLAKYRDEFNEAV
jgi:hypothetical protein